MILLKKIFAEKLRKAMKKENYNQTTLAIELECNRSTVSDWLSEEKLPSAFLLKKLTEVLHVSADFLLDSGYQPPKTLFKVGLIMESGSPFFSQILESILKSAKEKNVIIVPEFFDVNQVSIYRDGVLKSQEALINNLANSELDGFIIFPFSGTTRKHMQSIVKKNIPIVVVDEKIDDKEINKYFVGTNNRSASYEGLKYLITHLKKRDIPIDENHLAIVIPESVQKDFRSHTASERIKGCKEALNEFKSSAKELDSDFRIGDSYERIKNWLIPLKKENRVKDKSSPIAGIFSVSDLSTKGAILACLGLNLQIGKDIFLVGIDHIPDFNGVGPIPKITHLKQNTEKLGEKSLELILQQINNINLEQEKLIDVSLIRGNSCGESGVS
jgi:DNA-binding LacI/PurR family transcriptional regulator